MSNWTSLVDRLNTTEKSLTLNWDELESLVGKLPNSASIYRAWWSGERPHVNAWRKAGFAISDLQLGSKVTFIRAASRTTLGKRNSNSFSPSVDRPTLAAPQRDSMVTLGTHQFSHGSVINIRREEDGTPKLDNPSERYDNVRGLKLNKYGEGPFVFLQLSKLPDDQGVYAVVAADGQVLYVGQTADSIRNRWHMGYASIQPRNCFAGGQSTDCRINNLIYRATADGRYLNLYVYVSPEFDAIERELIAIYQPKWNVQGIR